MEFRSSNTKYVHFGGDILSNVDDGSSYGVQLTGGSTGGIVQPAGDTANVGLIVRGLGTGTVQLGNSSSPTRVGNSTTSIALMQRYLVQATVPALSSASSAESTVTVTGLTTNSILVLQNRVQLNSTVTGVTATPRCSTANELVVEFHNISQSSLSGSTQSWYLFQVSF